MFYKFLVTKLPKELVESENFVNAVLHADENDVRLEGSETLERIIVKKMAARSELCRIFLENLGFKNFLIDHVVNTTKPLVRAGMG